MISKKYYLTHFNAPGLQYFWAATASVPSTKTKLISLPFGGLVDFDVAVWFPEEATFLAPFFDFSASAFRFPLSVTCSRYPLVGI
jgi:hypothetical protein